MESPVRQPVGQFICFAVFGNDKKLLYSKYNFNFDLYISDKGISADLSKNEVFNLFLDENETDVLLPFSVKTELKKYFLPITEEIQQYFDDFNYSLGDFEANIAFLPERESQMVILENEFNLVYYNYFNQVQNMYEFLFTEAGSNLIFTKYNFNFTEYSNDFRIYGSKMCIFSDFIFRYVLLESVTHPDGYGYFNIPNIFRKYFYLDVTSQNNLNVFLKNKYSVYSSFATEFQSAVNINFTNYKTLIGDLYGITLSNDVDAYKYFLKYGQFQQDPITFNDKVDKEINNLSKAVCSIITDSSFGTGFLLWWENSGFREGGSLIVVTTYHLISESNKNNLFANCYYNESTNLKLMFRIIAYDKLMDICIALYDETLDYNNTYFPEDVFQINNTLTPIAIDEIFFNITQYKGQEITIIGNPQLIEYVKPLEGKIINPSYAGSFPDHFILARPTTILSDINISIGYSGSPVFTRDTTDGLLKLIGMVNAKTGDSNQFTVGISGSIFRSAVGNGLENYQVDVYPYYPDIDNRLVELLIQDMYAKKWLGAVLSYYQHVIASNLNSAFRTFSYNGGIIIHKFILGFDTINEVFLYEYEDLALDGVIRLNTPLLGTAMYQKYLENNNTPIVIKSIKMYDRVRRVYGDFNLGKYNGQVSFDVFTYCFTRNSLYYNSEEYVNTIRQIFPSIYITYYYFNGQEWVLNSESVGGSDDSWFVEYTDNSGYKFLQNRFEFPKIFLQYLQPFSDTNEPYLSEDTPSDSQLAKGKIKKKIPIPVRNSRLFIQAKN
jgi:hypothetical protein